MCAYALICTLACGHALDHLIILLTCFYMSCICKGVCVVAHAYSNNRMLVNELLFRSYCSRLFQASQCLLDVGAPESKSKLDKQVHVGTYALRQTCRAATPAQHAKMSLNKTWRSLAFDLCKGDGMKKVLTRNHKHGLTADQAPPHVGC